MAKVVTLANISRYATFRPSTDTVTQLKKRFGHDIKELFHIEPEALTAAEAEYINGFVSSDALRNRVAKEGQEGSRRVFGEKSLSGRPDNLDIPSVLRLSPSEFVSDSRYV